MSSGDGQKKVFVVFQFEAGPARGGRQGGPVAPRLVVTRLGRCSGRAPLPQPCLRSGRVMTAMCRRSASLAKKHKWQERKAVKSQEPMQLQPAKGCRSRDLTSRKSTSASSEALRCPSQPRGQNPKEASLVRTIVGLKPLCSHRNCSTLRTER